MTANPDLIRVGGTGVAYDDGKPIQMRWEAEVTPNELRSSLAGETCWPISGAEWRFVDSGKSIKDSPLLYHMLDTKQEVTKTSGRLVYVDGKKALPAEQYVLGH